MVAIFTSHLITVALPKGKKSVAGKCNSLPAETHFLSKSQKQLYFQPHRMTTWCLGGFATTLSHIPLPSAGQMHPGHTSSWVTGVALSLPLMYTTHIWKMDGGCVFTVKAQ